MLSEQISESILQIVETLPAVLITELATALKELDARNAEQPSSDFVSESLSKISERFSNPSTRYVVHRLFDLWKEEKQTNKNLTLRELSSALGILTLNRTKGKNRQKLELVWTGPASKIPIRQTRQVLAQLISSAQKELLIVSFVIIKIPEIYELLKNAMQRGVIITCIFESPEESDGKITFQGFADFNGDILKQIKILVWDKERRPVSPDGKTGTLHAKIAVADQSISFVSSANLTLNAMTLNMELGILLYDKIKAQEIVEHFEQLVLDGTLKTRVIDACILKTP